MPELPEVEIAARLLGEQLQGAVVESTLAPGMVALKSVKPPLETLIGTRVASAGRRGKMPHVDFEAPPGGEPLSLLVHMMSAGRLQVFDKRASLRDKRSRILIRFEDGRELRLREFGTKQRAWGKLIETAAIGEEEMVATLGPEAWPAPDVEVLAAALDQPRHLHPLLRDQRTIAGIGRSWVDEILWEARLSPFRKGADLSEDEIERLHAGARGARRRDRHLRGDASARRSRTRCRCRCRSTGARASPAPAAARRSPRSTTRTTSPVTARRSRTTASCSPTDGFRGC